jgi:hypothetical protein
VVYNSYTHFATNTVALGGMQREDKVRLFD